MCPLGRRGRLEARQPRHAVTMFAAKISAPLRRRCAYIEPLKPKRRMRTRKRTQWPWGHYKEAAVWARKSALGVKAAGWLRAPLRASCQPAALRGPRPGHACAGMPAPKSQGGKADGGLARSGNPPAAKRPPTPNALRPDKKAVSTCPHCCGL